MGDLERLGVHFDADRHGNLALGLEGGHSRRRVVHAGGSATGRRVVRQLSAVVVETAGLSVIEGARAATLWVRDGRCVGVVCEDGRAIHARAVILATGGSAALWQRTTNPPGSLGIGLLLARGAGAALADLELMQFHPTAVTGVKGREGFLVTEAIRGEGATLLDAGGERFVEELAPRDEVARAIWSKMAETRPAERRPRHARGRPGAVPQRRQRAARGRPRPGDRARARGPGGALRHGRGRRGPRRRHDGARPLRGRRERLHGPARRQSAGLELAERVLRLRRARSARRPLRAARRSRASRRPRRPSSSPAARPARRSGATPDWCATPTGLDALADDPHPLARLIARHALLRAESRGAHTRSDRPQTDPALDLHHSVTRGDADAPAFERWV